MRWIEIRLKTTSEACDAICEMLNEIGAGGVSINDPNDIRGAAAKEKAFDYIDEKLINPFEEDVTVKAYFPGSMNIEELKQIINEKLDFISNFLDTGKGYDGYCEIDEEDWATAWKKYYKPFKISDRVVIKPSWEEYSSGSDEVVIELDPGMAFGTGTHETTKMCAQLLEKYIRNGCSVLDVGCGTGILSIIAAKLGAGKVAAIDIDEVAVRVTKENIKINNVEEQIYVEKGTLAEFKQSSAEKYDIVVANIIANVIIEIAYSVPYYLKKDGLFITSGIIKERINDVKKACADAGFKHMETVEMGEWAAIVYKCQNSL